MTDSAGILLLFAGAFLAIALVLKFARSNESRPLKQQPTQQTGISMRYSIPSDPIQMESFTEPGKSYTVDLSNQSCTCADWQDRASYPIGNLHRLCKHLTKAILQSNPDQFTAVLLSECRFPLKPSTNYIGFITDNGNPVIAIRPAGNNWCDVIAKDREATFNRFGFNLVEHRWSYRNSPAGSLLIKEQLRRWQLTLIDSFRAASA